MLACLTISVIGCFIDWSHQTKQTQTWHWSLLRENWKMNCLSSFNFPVMWWLYTFPPRGTGGGWMLGGGGCWFQFSAWNIKFCKKTTRILRVMEKQPAGRLIYHSFIRIYSRRKCIPLRSLWSWSLLASVPVVCTCFRVSHHNPTFPQQQTWLQHSYKSLPLQCERKTGGVTGCHRGKFEA